MARFKTFLLPNASFLTLNCDDKSLMWAKCWHTLFYDSFPELKRLKDISFSKLKQSASTVQFLNRFDCLHSGKNGNGKNWSRTFFAATSAQTKKKVKHLRQEARTDRFNDVKTISSCCSNGPTFCCVSGYLRQLARIDRFNHA